MYKGKKLIKKILILVEKNCKIFCVLQDFLYLCILIPCVCIQKILNHVRKHIENFTNPNS